MSIDGEDFMAEVVVSSRLDVKDLASDVQQAKHPYYAGFFT